MGKVGWLTIRNVPDVRTEKSSGGLSSNAYYQQLVKFLKYKKLCPKCGGVGHRFKIEGAIRESTVVRFEGIEELEKLNSMDGVSMTDVIRDILERRCLGKRPCSLCHGSRFVKVERATVYKQKRKNRGKKKKTQRSGKGKSNCKSKKTYR